MKVKIKDKTLTRDMQNPYIIAEIGCNHNGDIRTAHEMIKVAADCGVDAVKFQKRDPDELFVPAALEAPYDSPNSHGKTYGEHRRALDGFGENEFLQIAYTCHEMGVAFICTPFTIADALFLKDLDLPPDAYKIASCDLQNFELITMGCMLEKPVIISTGGHDVEESKIAAAVLGKASIVLHCISIYPNDDNLYLQRIERLRNAIPDSIIGFSSHHAGLLPFPLAYMMGARVFEVHFTLNRGQRGTDHGFSLEPEGLRKLCSDSKRYNTMLYGLTDMEAQKNGFITKMGKSVYAVKKIKAGDCIKHEDVKLMAPMAGCKPYELSNIIGSIAKKDYEPYEVF